MARSRLYTVNKWNKDYIIPEDNVYSIGGALGSAWNSLGTEGQKGVIGAGLETLGNMKIDGTKRGLYDAADPLYWAANGNESVVGNAVSDIGVGLFKQSAKSGNLTGMAAGGIVKGVGSLINASMGTKVDKKKLAEAKQGTDYLKNFNPTANTFGEVENIASVGNIDNPYGAGWFRKGWARRRNRKLRKERAFGMEHANSALENNLYNLSNEQMMTGLRSYYPFGGPLGMPYDNSGAINYDFMSDYLINRRKQLENKPIGIRAMGNNMFALGGDVQMHGGDYTTGLVHVDEGDSHSENPYGGVQVGTDNQGIPNLVEENEVIYDDYVFSNRIQCDDTTKSKFHIGKKREITYADLAKKLEKEISERPNDPISQAGFKVQMKNLEEQQERQKQEMEAERAREAFEALPPEEQVAMMNRAAQEEQMAQEAIAQQAIQEEALAQQETMEQPQMSPEEAAMMEQQAVQQEVPQEEIQPEIQANGGYLFDDGGRKARKYAKKYNRDWFISRAKELGLLDEDATDLEGFDFNEDSPIANLENFNRLYDAYQKDKDLESYKATKRAAKKKELFDEKKGLYRMSDDGSHIMKAKLDENGDRALDDNGKVIWEAYDGDEASILDAFKDDYEKGHEWDSKKANKLEYPIEDPKDDPLRKAGVYAPLVGLSMMGAGIGKPDYYELDKAMANLRAPSVADVKYVGNYLKFRPYDVNYALNMLNANSRATDRAIMNNANPFGTKMAGLLANSLANQIAAGNVYRQALEYNDAKRAQVEEFNRGTNVQNANAFNQNAQFNANAINAYNQAAARLGMAAANTKLENNAGWYNSLYGNVNNLFKGMSDLGRENTDRNWLNWYIDKVGIPGLAKRANGGRIKKRKRGLTC